ncbi:MAG: glutamate--tRNA ligase [Parvibaculaceae bacterium]
MTVTVRFAPSPTGLLHIGNGRAAVVNWLYALKVGGRFILRLDDTDAGRSKPEYEAAIRDDLAWLGIAPAATFRQSERLDVYRAAAETLKRDGRLYPCYETPEELDYKRKRQRSRGEPPVYDRAALKLGPAEREKLEAEGRAPHWRFLLERRPVPWEDLVRGPQTIDTGTLSDPVLIRADGTGLYTFTSVVDDADLGVTHVIRGEDHVVNTAAQIELFQALGSSAPAFAHLSLLVGSEGEALSKRLGSLSLKGLREEGIEPMTVMSLAALLGTSEALRPFARLDELVEVFGLEKFSRAPARFDLAELRHLNAKLLHALPYTDVQERLAVLGADGGEAFWNAVRGNLETVGDVAAWHEVVTADRTFPADPDARPFLTEAAELLPPEPWTDTTWKAWTGVLSAATGLKGRALFQPLRRALTGADHGPELAALLPLIGRALALKRLAGG